MSITSQNLVSNYSHTRISFYFKTPNLKTLNVDFNSLSHFQTLKTQSVIPYRFQSILRHNCAVRALDSDGYSDKQQLVADSFDVDAFLSVAEFISLASSAVLSIGFVISSTFSTSHKPVLEWYGIRGPVWLSLLLISGVVIGAVIRRRQWMRVCVGFSTRGSSGVNLLERVERVEEDVRNSATLIRMLARHLEKLKIRFRVTRRTLKDPIAETAALAQKNSEATRALAAQEDLLEKEFVEIQNVLLAMQDHQQKQLELILTLAKTVNLRKIRPGTTQDGKISERAGTAQDGKRSERPGATQDGKRSERPGTTQDGKRSERHNSTAEEVKEKKTDQVQAFASKETNNDGLPA